MVLLHDTFFYWLHRAMHTRLLFERVHRLHHESLYPTAFAAYSFSWIEATAEALIVTAIMYIIPAHPLALLIFQTISTAYNVYGHCGREFYPQGMDHHWLGRWLNTSTLHAHHHHRGRGNYSFYFTFWDRLMGTLEEPVSGGTLR
jgi:sterol desaturase/sphingolipid hydroxylase (fatty acid hydroxylase superfamily)